jgi:hypothetical protein
LQNHVQGLCLDTLAIQHKELVGLFHPVYFCLQMTVFFGSLMGLDLDITVINYSEEPLQFQNYLLLF